MEELQRVFGYLQKYTGGSIPIDIEDPIRRAVYTTGQQWMNSTPMPRKISQMTCSSPKEWKPIDRLCRCRSCSEQSRRSVTGIIMLLNNTPLVWISKGRKTVETSTYGSELVAAKSSILSLDAIQVAPTRRTWGANRDAGNNMSVVLNTTIPSSSLKKKSGMLIPPSPWSHCRKVRKFGHVRSERI
jgi:hypothetical protein